MNRFDLQSFGRKKREATETPDSEEQSLEERNGKVLFKPARWDFSPTSGAAVTVGALSAMSSLIWTIIHGKLYQHLHKKESLH